jgi:hypothetical protein
MSFDAYAVNSEDVEFEKILHTGLGGGYAEDILGYRRKISIDFAPLFAPSPIAGMEAETFLYGFAFGANRSVIVTSTVNVDDTTIGTTTTAYAVTFDAENVKFSFENGYSFANGFTMEFLETELTANPSDGSTRTLLPILSGSDSAVGTYQIDLVDASTVKVQKKSFKFVGGGRGDNAFGYLHLLSVNFGAITDSRKRDWLRDFCCWGVKQIDTRQIDPVFGRVWNVVCLDSALNWKFQNNIKDAPSITINFAEKTLRETIEPLPPLGAPFILDRDTLDSKIVGT